MNVRAFTGNSRLKAAYTRYVSVSDVERAALCKLTKRQTAIFGLLEWRGIGGNKLAAINSHAVRPSLDNGDPE